MSRSAAVLVAAALLAACDSTATDPCARDLACNVAGIDIAILSVTPRWADDQDFDATVGMRVVRPGDAVEADVVVMNRGTVEATRAAELIALGYDHGRPIADTLRVEPLGVGERATYRFRFELADGPRFIDASGPVGARVEEIRLLHGDYQDADSANDRRAGFEFHVDAPLLELELAGLPDTMVVQTTYTATLTIRNHSDTRSFAGGLEVEFCALYQTDDPCERGHTDAVSPVTIGAVAAGASRVQPVSIRFSRDALRSFDVPSRIAVAPCVELGIAGRDCLLPADFDPEAGYETVGMPALIVDCDAPALGDESTVVLADALCDHRLGRGDVVYAVAWLEAEAGDCWRTEFVSSSSGTIIVREAATLELLDHEDAIDCWRVERSGAQVIIVRPATPGGTPSGTLRTRQIQ